MTTTPWRIADAVPGVAVQLYYQPALDGSGIRPYVAPNQVWCESGYHEWWPFTASAVDLFTQREKRGVRALCEEAP